MILDGRLVASHILDTVKIGIEELDTDSPIPSLAVVLVGDNPSSLAYIRMKERRAKEVGMNFCLYHYPESISEEELDSAIRKLSITVSIHGIIIQAPLPAHIDRYAMIECIAPAKDVDGFTKTQIGNMFLGHNGLWSCTPKGIMTLLAHYGISVKGKVVAVIGRSNIVGKPMALMLINAGATVISCNSSTKRLADITKSADIVIVAAGSPRLLRKSMVSKHTIVVDVGSTFIDGKTHGDADYKGMEDYVRAITPAPGGVGPMTVATLIDNTWKAYLDQNSTL